MSWDASLYMVNTVTECPSCGHKLDKPYEEEQELGWWNYTSNTSKMIYDALEKSGIVLREGESWWDHLNGMSGQDGRSYLSVIIRQLEAEPERYRTMNPTNGWGNYNSLLRTLKNMRDEDINGTTKWHVSG